MSFWYRFLKLEEWLFLSHHSITHPGRCWRWTQTPGSPSGSSLTGESAPCSASAWTKKKRKKKEMLIYLFLKSHQGRQSWGFLLRHQGGLTQRFLMHIISNPLPLSPFRLRFFSAFPLSHLVFSSLCLIGVAGPNIASELIWRRNWLLWRRTLEVRYFSELTEKQDPRP